MPSGRVDYEYQNCLKFTAARFLRPNSSDVVKEPMCCWLAAGWNTSNLSTRVGVSEWTILAFEAGDLWSPPLHLDLVREAIEAAGVEFIAENAEGPPGVRLRKARSTE
jgi:hypothetical protein